MDALRNYYIQTMLINYLSQSMGTEILMNSALEAGLVWKSTGG